MASDSSIQEDFKFTPYGNDASSSTGIALGLNTGYYSWSKDDVHQLLSWVAENMPESFKRLNKANINAITEGAFPNHSRIKCSNVKNKLSNLKRRYLVLKLKLKKVNASNDASEAEKIQKAISRDLPFFEIIDSLMLQPDSPGSGTNSTGTGNHRLSLSPSTTDYIFDTTGSSTGGMSPIFDENTLESPDQLQYQAGVPTSPQTAFKQRMRAARRHSPYNLPASLSVSRRNSETILGKAQQQACYTDGNKISSGANMATTASSTSSNILSPSSLTPPNPYDYMLQIKPPTTTLNNTENISNNNNNTTINNKIKSNDNDNNSNTNSIINNDSNDSNIFSLPSSTITTTDDIDSLDLLDSNIPSHAFVDLPGSVTNKTSSHQLSNPGLAATDNSNTHLIPSLNINTSNKNTKNQLSRSIESAKQQSPISQHHQALLESLTKYEIQKRLEIEFFKAKEELALKRYETEERLKMEHTLNAMKAQILAKQLDKAKAELDKINIDSGLAAVELETKRLDLEKLKQNQQMM